MAAAGPLCCPQVVGVCGVASESAKCICAVSACVALTGHRPSQRLPSVLLAENVETLTEQLSTLEASSAELSRNLQELQQEHSKASASADTWASVRGLKAHVFVAVWCDSGHVHSVYHVCDHHKVLVATTARSMVLSHCLRAPADTGVCSQAAAG